MREVGIRELKAKASSLVRRVAEEHATYTITSRGRPVGVLAPADFLAGKGQATARDAWARLLGLAEGMAKQPDPRKSAVRELERMRR